MPVSLNDLEKYTGQLLQCDRFRDYAPNGLQVEGRPSVQRLACGVTASLALLESAIAWGADALLVHHGYFWRGEDPRIIGTRKQRLQKLLVADMSLLAYHLPLDAHTELGNNAQLAARLGLVAEGRFGEQDMGWYGTPAEACTLSGLGQRISAVLGRSPVLVGDPAQAVGRIGWCSGGAQGYFAEALAIGCTVYLTGEASERNYHEAVEAGAAFVAAGHHATERYGVQALANHLDLTFGLETQYFELDNPL